MAEKLPYYAHRPRIFILSDITNEPDDSQSFCRYLTYANQFDTEGVVATTSTWLRRRVAPEALLDIVDGYEQVVENLNAHAHPDSPYPSADYIRSIIKPGAPVYGMEAIGDDIPLSPGAQLLLARLLSPDPRPLWILVWGGTNVLASVIYHIRHRLNAAQLRAKLRIYAIGDQDDTGAWMRQQWPDLFYICSVHGWNNYGSAGWIGISVDLPQDVGGPDPSMVSNDWIRKNIQIGPLGAKYPDVQYGMEGDTPTFLYHIQNGLGVSEEPSWGSWGGRWLSVNVSSKGLPKGHRADACDEVVGMNGVKHYSPRAAIWRWRNAFQADFQARIQWTLTQDFAACNHAPVVCVNGDKSLAPLYIDVDAGSSVVLDASASYDPDGDALEYKWWQYKEPSAILSYHSFEVVDLRIDPSSDSSSIVQVHVPGPDTSCTIKKELKLYDHDVVLEKGSPLHVILEVKDNGSPALTTYRRVVITPVNREFKQKL